MNLYLEVGIQSKNLHWQTTMGGMMRCIQSRNFIGDVPIHPQVSARHCIKGKLVLYVYEFQTHGVRLTAPLCRISVLALKVPLPLFCLVIYKVLNHHHKRAIKSQDTRSSNLIVFLYSSVVTKYRLHWFIISFLFYANMRSGGWFVKIAKGLNIVFRTIMLVLIVIMKIKFSKKF